MVRTRSTPPSINRQESGRKYEGRDSTTDVSVTLKIDEGTNPWIPSLVDDFLSV
jgi:hypothetical protein